MMETKEVKFQFRIDYAINGYIVSYREHGTKQWSSPEVYYDVSIYNVIRDVMLKHGDDLIYEAEFDVRLSVPQEHLPF